MKKNNSFIGFLCVFLGVWFVWVLGASAVDYQLNESGKIRVNISPTGLNRISMNPYEIKQVTGDESKYRLKHDPDGKNIYLMPTTSDEIIEVSIKSSIGNVQDLELVVTKNIKGQTINITNHYYDQDRSKESELELKSMLYHMSQGAYGKYYVREVEKVIPNDFGLHIKQTKFYKFNNFEGAELVVSNKSQSSGRGSSNTRLINLKEIGSLFKGRTIAMIKGGNNKLSGPRTYEYVFVAVKNEEEK